MKVVICAAGRGWKLNCSDLIALMYHVSPIEWCGLLCFKVSNFSFQKFFLNLPIILDYFMFLLISY